MTGGRNQQAPPAGWKQAGLIFLTDYILVDVSSTEVRRRARQNLPIQGTVPEGVADYIRKYELYKAGEPDEIK